MKACFTCIVAYGRFARYMYSRSQYRSYSYPLTYFRYQGKRDVVGASAAQIEGIDKGPSIKYVCSKREGVRTKAYICCFYGVILLFKSVQGRRGCLKMTKYERTYFMGGP